MTNNRSAGLTIFVKQTLFVALAVICSASLMNWIGFRFAQQSLSHQIYERLNTVSHNREQRLNAYVAQQKERAALVASRTRLLKYLVDHSDDPSGVPDFHEGTQKILQDASNSTKEFLAIWITDPEGRVVAATEDEYLGQDYSTESDFLQGKKDGHLGRPRRENDGYQLLLTAPAKTGDGRFLGVVMVLLDARGLVQLLDDTNGLGETGEVLVATRKGDQLEYLLPSRRHPDITSIAADRAAAMIDAFDSDSGHGLHQYDGRAVLVAWRPVQYQSPDFQHWGMVVKIDAEEAFAPIAQLRTFQWLMEGALVVLSVCLGFFLAGRFMKPIRALAAATDAVTQRRDYSIRVEKTSQDELGVLCDGFNSMLDQIQQQESELGRSNSELEKTVGNQRTMLAQLQERETELKSANTELDRTIQGVRDAVVQLSSMSEELTATVSQQSTGARQQAHAISETVATVSQITQTSSHASERANSAREAAKRALEVGKDGRQAVLDSIEAMEEVNKQVGATAVNTVSLAERVLAISRILRTISDIAEQTNVLALNAAIEASRAGEQGKGFAVVAKEVKHLAASSKDATDQIRQIIREIHEATNTTVRSTEEGTQSAQRARSIVSKAGKTIDALADALVETSQAATQIVASSNQQARGIADVNDAMKQINATTQQQIAVAHQIEQTAQFLTQLSDGLSRLIKADDSTAE